MAFGSNLVALGDAMPWVAQQLDKMSGGRIKLQVFEPGKLVPALAVFDAVSEGKAEAGYTWMGYEVGKVPAAALFGAVPFGMESPTMADVFRPAQRIAARSVKPISIDLLRHDRAGRRRLVPQGDQHPDDIKV
jgi:TRAP-type mannitol/chloroaromatic compound transport system substrate-binding protein